MTSQPTVAHAVADPKFTVVGDSVETVRRQRGDSGLSTNDSAATAAPRARLNAIIGGLVYTVAALSFALSYLHTVAWFAIEGGPLWQPWATALLPESVVIVCLLIVKVGGLGRPGQFLVWGGLIISYGLVIAANVSQADQTTPSMIKALAPPAISFYLVVIKLVIMGDHAGSVIEPVIEPTVTQPPALATTKPVIAAKTDRPAITSKVPITPSSDRAELINLIKESPEKYTRQYLQTEFRLSPATAGRYRRAAGVTS